MSKFHVVKQGECLTSIAAEYGFADPKTIYDFADNEDFRKRRPNPNIIFENDRVAIPDPTPKSFDCPTGSSHKFVIKRPTRELNLQLLDVAHEPIADTEYELRVDQEKGPRKGKTDGDGFLHEKKLPPDATSATLLFQGEEMDVLLGHLNPMDQVDDDGVSGVQARLASLGYYDGEVDGELGPDTRDAIRCFQGEHGLTVDGEIKDDLRSALSDEHGC